MRREQNVRDYMNRALTDLRNVIIAHDAVHPDRSDCGGVGGCVLMLTEHQAEEEVISVVTSAARLGVDLRVVLVGGSGESAG